MTAMKIPKNHPFKYYNGQQTPESKALEQNKKAHKPQKPQVPFQEALL